MKKFLLLFIISTSILHAEIEIQSYKKNYSWKPEWTAMLKQELKSDQMKENFLSLEIADEDLLQLDCPNYNKAGVDDKADFWIVFFSALTRAESGFNEKAVSPNKKGPKSFGLLQLAKLTAKRQCDIESVLDGGENLKCGLKLMEWQLQGLPVKNGKKLHPEIEGHIFSKTFFQWGPLRESNINGRKFVINWFKNHRTQLKFCSDQE